MVPPVPRFGPLAEGAHAGAKAAAHGRPPHGGAGQARIGPNAITRVAESLEARLGFEAAQSLFRSAGLAHHLTHPPGDMVDEHEVARLQAQLRVTLGADAARTIARDAGRRTGDYLLEYRIPRLAQRVLEVLPASIAARILASAIARHAWTFAGSGTFTFAPGRPFVLTIASCPMCREISTDAPACDFYAATFERIFCALVNPRTRVTETACQAAGAPACTFQAAW
jgi:divinyl protochlorophyllide a 8-vinyl-reductase